MKHWFRKLFTKPDGKTLIIMRSEGDLGFVHKFRDPFWDPKIREKPRNVDDSITKLFKYFKAT